VNPQRLRVHAHHPDGLVHVDVRLREPELLLVGHADGDLHRDHLELRLRDWAALQHGGGHGADLYMDAIGRRRDANARLHRGRRSAPSLGKDLTSPRYGLKN